MDLNSSKIVWTACFIKLRVGCWWRGLSRCIGLLGKDLQKVVSCEFFGRCAAKTTPRPPTRLKVHSNQFRPSFITQDPPWTSQNLSDNSIWPELARGPTLLFHAYHDISCRLGAERGNKVQPLLVTFADSSEPEYLVRNARLLRSVVDDYVKNSILFNKHMTYAERKAAYEARLLRRNSISVPSHW